MNGKQYFKNQLPVILIHLLGMLSLALFLIAGNTPVPTVVFITAVWSVALVVCLLCFYFSRKKHLNQLLDMTERLEERYLLPEIMPVPERADEQVFYQIMKAAEKSMLERSRMRCKGNGRNTKNTVEQSVHEMENTDSGTEAAL